MAKLVNLNQPIAEVARPNSIKDLILPQIIKKDLLNFIQSPETMPHLIFYGPPGTGKTSAAKILAKEILKNTTDFNYKELNASVDRGVEVVRTDILNFVNNRSFFKIDTPYAPYKIVFLDEADMLTGEAQNALRNMMETYATNCRFILSCNMYEKIVPAIKSRTLLIKFDPLNYEEMKQRIIQINEKFDLKYPLKKIELACELAQGDFRIAYNFLSGNTTTNSKTQIEQFVKFIVYKSISVNLKQAYEIINLKKDIIEKNTKPFYKILCEILINLENPKIFLLLDRLANAEAATYNGATQLVQFMGWYGFYRNLCSI